MPVEGPIVDLSSLNESWPLDSDLQSETDDHIRLVKDALKKAFSDLGSVGGVVTVSATELNSLSGISENVQQQLDYTDTRWVYAGAAALSPVGGEKYLFDPPVGGVVVTLPNAPLIGSEIQMMHVEGLAAENTMTINRSGADTILDLDSGTAGLTTIVLGQTEYRYFVYYKPSIWCSWSLPGRL